MDAFPRSAFPLEKKATSFNVSSEVHASLEHATALERCHAILEVLQAKNHRSWPYTDPEEVVIDSLSGTCALGDFMAAWFNFSESPFNDMRMKRAADQSYAPACYLLGLKAIMQNDLAGAEHSFQLVAEQDYAPACYQLALLAQHKGNRTLALEYFQKAADQDYGLAHYQLGIQAWNDGDDDLTESYFQKASKREYSTLMHHLKAQRALVSGNLEKALFYFKAAAACNNFLTAKYQYSCLALKMGQRADGFAEMIDAANRGYEPAHPQIADWLKCYKTEPDKFEDSKKAFNQFLMELKCEVYESTCQIKGWIALKDGDKNKAVQHFEVGAKESYAPAQYMLATLLSEIPERKQECNDLFQKSADQGYPPALKMLANISFRTVAEHTEQNLLTALFPDLVNSVTYYLVSDSECNDPSTVAWSDHHCLMALLDDPYSSDQAQLMEIIYGDGPVSRLDVMSKLIEWDTGTKR